MKVNQILIGRIYTDGKSGIREVTHLGGHHSDDSLRVTYNILAARHENKYDYHSTGRTCVIGESSSCEISSFASWAKTSLSKAECDAKLVDLAALKLKLPPGERDFMQSLGDQHVNCAISFTEDEKRAARGDKKRTGHPRNSTRL